MKKLLESEGEYAFHSSCTEEVVKQIIDQNIKILSIEGLRKDKEGDRYFLDTERIFYINSVYDKDATNDEINERALYFVRLFSKEKDLYMIPTTSPKIPEEILNKFRGKDL